MSAHQVTVTDGAEYEGETYIRCQSCGLTFDDGHAGLDALIKFLQNHDAIEDCAERVAEAMAGEDI